MAARLGRRRAAGVALATGGLLLATILPLSASRAAGTAPPIVAGCGVFPASTAAPTAKSAADQTAWNQDVSRAPVAKNSSKVINHLPGKLHPDFGSNTKFGIPYEVVDQGQPNVDVEIGPHGYPDESDFGPAPIPLDAAVEGGDKSKGDRHVVVAQSGSCRLFELYRAFRTSGGWRADATASFNLAAAGPLRHDGYTSADAGGLPILPGLVRYHEVAAGAVDHAIRLTFGETRRAYIHPATHYAGSSCSSRLPAMGLRLRMKPGYFRQHLSGYPKGSQSRAIFVALYHYGFMVADNGSDWFFQGGSDPRWNDDDLSRLKRVPGSAFQVVQSAARTKTGC